ncbi:MAG: PD-(D/E)XK nuclease domain-containing protein, partial [Rhodospirillales bacterium]|nr:PD-(D/E)XK nuclease domain-containing protein [Rhodospirillales bacterium]
LDAFSAETYYKKLNTLFVQTGYLTFAGQNPVSDLYSLKYPNQEVQKSMTENIIDFVLHIDKVQWGNMIERFRIALGKNDIDAFCGHMRDFFRLIPHTIVIKHEHFFQGIFFSVATAVGAQIEAEYGTYRGFIDAVIETDDHVFVIEFKHDKTPKAALKQIQNKDYFRKFKIEGTKPITLVGMNFDWTETGIVMEWIHVDGA